MAPTYLQDLMPDQVQARTRYNLRNVENRDIPLARISSYSNSFFPAATRQWNNLKETTKQSPTPDSFKRNFLKENPRPKRNLLYYRGSRQNQIIHAKLRLGCSPLNFDLHAKLHVIDSPLCSCDLSEPEIVEHFFFHCPKYTRIRRTMRAGITTLDPQCYNVHSVLHGNPNLDEQKNIQLFKIVHQFLDASKRF